MNKEPISWQNIIRVCTAIFVTFTCCILLFFLLLRFQGIADAVGKVIHASASIIIGLLLTFILNPVNINFYQLAKEKLQKNNKYRDDPVKLEKLSKVAGITLTTLLLIAVLTLLIVAVVPSVIKSVVHLVNAIPTYTNVITAFIRNGQFGDSAVGKAAQNIISVAADDLESWFNNSVLSQAQAYLASLTSGVITGVISVIKGIMNFIIGIIVMDYVMAIQGTLTGQTKKIIYAVLKPKTANRLIDLIRKASDVFGGFLTGKIIDSAIIAVITYVGCLILQIPDVVLVTLIIGVTNIIPFFGPFIGAVPSLLLVVVQSPWHALYLLIFIIVLQQVDGNIIGPKILGNSTGLSSFWIMVAILIGGGIFGLPGMIFGVPVMAMIQYVVNGLISRRLKEKELPQDTTTYRNLDYIDPNDNKLVSKELSEKKKASKVKRMESNNLPEN